MDLLHLTKELCAISSVTGSGGTREIFDLCSAFVPGGSREKAPSPGAGDTLRFVRQGSGSKSFLLLGHYDTVPGAQGISEKDGRLQSLGAYDMKGGVAIALHLLRDLPEDLFQTAELRLFGDEEWRDVPPRVEKDWDAVLAFEGGPLVRARWGAARADISLRGEALRATKSSKQGTLDALEELLRFLRSSRGAAHLSLSQLRAEGPLNVVPGIVTAAGVLRYRSQGDLQDWLRGFPISFPGADAEIDCKEIIPPMPESAATARLLRELRLWGEEREGASDISWFRASCRIDGLGPLGGGDHSSEEWIDVASLRTQLLLSQKIIRYLASGEATT